jgi:hypothetical protein
MSERDFLVAQAVMAIRALILRHPRKTSSLIPFEWSSKFSGRLGQFAVFVKSRSPDIFSFEEHPATGLLSVRLSSAFQREGYLVFQRLLTSFSLSETQSDEVAPDDPQYTILSEIKNQETRSELAGGSSVILAAAEVLREFTLKFPQGARLSKVAEAFSKSGIPPLPLEWFDELLVRTLPDNVYLRSSSNRSDLSQTPMTQSIVDVIASIPSKKGSMGYTSRALGISIPELIAVVKGCSLFFYDPGMVFPCRYFEDLVVGYVSYETLVKRQERVELSSMSPFRHLVRIVAASLFYSPDKRIPSEHVLAWCHALDVKPRLLWQCLQDKVFWSNAHAELQVLRRNPSDSVNATTYGCDETALPRDLLDDIKDKVARLGNQSSIEKLSQALQWGKSSENRRKYGPLSAVLKKHPDIFYEPDFMFWKESLIKKVSFPETDIPSEAIIDKADTEFLQLSQISNMLVYYLTQEGYQAYPKDDILRILSSVGMDEEYLKRLSRVFVPGSNIYLRKLPCEVRFEAHSIEEFIFFALKASGRKAVEISKLFQKLAECESFDEAITSEARAEILSSCGNILDADQTPLSRICFYNPDVILLDCVATMNLQIPEQHYKNGEHVDFTSKQTQIE